jgi:hypothetical protein
MEGLPKKRLNSVASLDSHALFGAKAAAVHGIAARIVIAEGCAMRRNAIFSRGAGIVTAALAAIVASVAPASAVDALEPGLWSIATKIGHGGREMPLRKVEQCFLPDDVRTSGASTSLQWGGKDVVCESTAHRKTDSGGAFQIQCTGKTAFDATLSYTLKGPRHYTIVFAAADSSPEPIRSSTRTIEGRRLGDCRK